MQINPVLLLMTKKTSQAYINANLTNEVAASENTLQDLNDPTLIFNENTNKRTKLIEHNINICKDGDTMFC